MTQAAEDFADRTERQEAAGLALLSAESRLVLDAGPHRYRRSVACAVSLYQEALDSDSDTANALYGQVLGLLIAGHDFDVLSWQQHHALFEQVRLLKARP